MDATELLYIAADPGKKGAIAALRGEHLMIMDMPVGEDGEIDPTALCALLHKAASLGLPHFSGPEFFLLEVQGPRRLQDPRRVFKSGRGLGLLEMGAAMLGWPVRWTRPSDWKKAMAVPEPPRVMTPNQKITERKRLSIARAGEVFEGHKHMWTRQLDHGRAEAALLAEFARRSTTSPE